MQRGDKLIRKSIKIFGGVAVVLGIGLLLVDRSPGAELLLLAGLFVLFVSHEIREDERSVILKASSAQMALIIGYGFKLLTSYLYDLQVLTMQLVAINHFLILVFALALVIYQVRLRTA